MFFTSYLADSSLTQPELHLTAVGCIILHLRDLPCRKPLTHASLCVAFGGGGGRQLTTMQASIVPQPKAAYSCLSKHHASVQR